MAATILYGGASVLRPPFAAATTTKVKAKSKRVEDAPRSTGFGWVLRRDWEFLSQKLEPLSFLKSRFSKAIGDTFPTRTLEAAATPPEDYDLPTWPTPSYPGLSGMDLLMADLEALKLYISYFQKFSKLWSMPLPEKYDPEKVAMYFKYRPHVLSVRILEVFSSFTLAAIKLQASKRLKFTRDDGESENSDYYFGKVLKETMLRLGPTFIKVGQSLSTRPDLIGSEIAKALSELQENIAPFPRGEAMKIIEEELGCPVEDAFSYVSAETVAAASFGQVYRGLTSDGCHVAIKVQRPNMLHSVVCDIYILRLVLGLVRKLAKRRSDIRLYADELGRGFVGELDYMLEAENAAEFLEAHSRFSFIAIPKVFKHLTKKRVLTMQWLHGASPSELVSLSSSSGLDGDLCPTKQQIDSKKDLLDLVNKGVKASLIQLLDTGLLHADPHPGNLRYTQGQIGFFDFGLLCRMEKKHQLAMLASITHIFCGEWGALVQDLTEMDVIPPGTNIRSVTWDLEETFSEAVFVNGIPDIQFSKVLGKIWSVALKYHFRMPPYYALVLRSLASLEGLAVAADPNFKTFLAACPYVIQKLIYENTYATRRIVYSVVFTKCKEFQWHRLQLFFNLGLARNSTRGPNTTRSIDLKESRNDIVEVASVICRLLTSDDGIVVRRLLMEVNSVSLVQAAISKDALVFRQGLSKALAGVIYGWMFGNAGTGTGSQDRFASVNQYSLSATSLSAVARDRRVKVIFYKVMNAVRSHPVLLLRFWWCCLTVLMTSSALALHWRAVSLAEKYMTPSLARKQRNMAVMV